jgi:hypothetical protein
LIGIKIFLHVYLIDKGFVSVSADEFARGINAAEWALNPSLNIISNLNWTWLPFEKILNGSIMILWPEPYWVPRITVMIFSCLVLILMYAVTYSFFESHHVSFLSCLITLFLPWYAWLSATPMLEIYYQAFFFGGFWFLIKWYYQERKLYWLWGALCFLIASTIHVEAWLQINCFFLITLIWVFSLFRNKDFKRSIELFSVYVISNLFAFLLLILEYVKSGNPFEYFSRHTEYSKWFYQGYDVSIIERFLYYPKLIIQNSNILIWVFLIIAFYLLLKRNYKGRFYILIGLALLSLLLSSIFNIFSVPPTAAPDRYSLFYMLTIAPYLAFSLYEISKAGIEATQKRKKHFLLTVAVIGLLFLIVIGGIKISRFPSGLSQDSINTGYFIKTILDDDNSKFMVELKYWEFLAVQMTAGHYSDIIFDREYILTERDKESVLLGSKEYVDEIFVSQDIKYLVIQDTAIKEHIDQLNSFQVLTDIGNWRILKFIRGSIY